MDKLNKEMEKLIKLRNKASKEWNSPDMYYYQGQIDLLDKMIKELWYR